MRSRPAKGTALTCGHPTVITGAGGDLGKALALRLASRGESLALVDDNTVALRAAYEECRALSRNVTRWCLDVSSWDATQEMADRLDADVGPAHALFNFAGIIHAGRLTDSAPRDLERVVSVDLVGTMAMTRALLPHLERTGHGRLVNASSAFGVVAVAGYSPYNAAKFGVRGFTEALQQEVDGSGVLVTAVYLGGVRTGIMRRATYGRSVPPSQVQERFDRTIARLSPGEAADKILAGVGRRRPQLFIGVDAKTAHVVTRVVGGRYTRLTRRMGLH